MALKQEEITSAVNINTATDNTAVETVKIIYEKETLGKIFRIYGTDVESTYENPLFLAQEVAEWIDYAFKDARKTHRDVSKMLGTVDESEKVLKLLRGNNLPPTQDDNSARNQEGNPQRWFLTEDGLYEVLMQSRKPLAKQFKKQVKAILKEIRRTGSYSSKPLTATQMFIAAAKALEEQEQRISAVENSLASVNSSVSVLTDSMADINERLNHEAAVNAFIDHSLDIKDKQQQVQLDRHEADIEQLKKDNFVVKEDISTDIKGFINLVFNHYPQYREQGQRKGKQEVYQIFYGAVSEAAGYSSTHIATLISERRRRLVSQGLSEATARTRITGISIINSDLQLRTAAMGIIKNIEDIIAAEECLENA